jgi:hypothetical protein
MNEYLCASPECPNGLHKIADKAMEGMPYVIVENPPGRMHKLQIRRHKWLSRDGTTSFYICDDCLRLDPGGAFTAAKIAQEGRQG